MKEAEQKAEEVFMTILRRFNAQGRNAADTAGTSYAPARLTEQPDNEGITKDQFRGAMNRLFAAG